MLTSVVVFEATRQCRKLVLCGTKLGLADVAHVSSGVCTRPGQSRVSSSQIINGFSPWSHEEFRKFLSACLKPEASFDEFMLPPEMFPGLA